MGLFKFDVGFDDALYGVEQTAYCCNGRTNPTGKRNPVLFRLRKESLLVVLYLRLFLVQVVQLLCAILNGLRLLFPFLCTLRQLPEFLQVLAQHFVEFLHTRLVVTHVAGIDAVRLFQCRYFGVQRVYDFLLAFVLVRQFAARNLYLSQFVFLNRQLRRHTFERVLVGVLGNYGILHLSAHLADFLLVRLLRLGVGGKFT